MAYREYIRKWLLAVAGDGVDSAPSHLGQMQPE
jgi:hypothetical protein